MAGEFKLLLTTSGVGSRLGNITKFTNKSLVRVGKKPAISYIIERYSPSIEIVVTLGYFGKHVKEFLSLAYPDRKITFIEVDKYEGSGSSLLYSISQAKEALQCPFIFHACDTIVNGLQVDVEENWLAGYPLGDPSQYRSYNLSNGFVESINEKGELNPDYFYIGVCGIKDYVSFWNHADMLLNEQIANQSLSDCDVIRKMMQATKFTHKNISKWLDIGNMASLNKSRAEIEDCFHILDKDEESIFLFDKFVIKFFSDTKLCTNRVKRATILDNIVPKVVGSCENFYKYEYAEGELASRVATPKTIESLIEWAIKNLWIEKQHESFTNICKDFYIDKTKKRIKLFLSNNNMTDTHGIINDIMVPSAGELLDAAEEHLLKNCNPTGFHGDFILDNILVCDNSFTLLDWRQDFGGELESGDMYYDIAKLNHNLVVNHDIINADLFTIDTTTTNVKCDIMRNHRLVECQDALYEIAKIKGLDINKIQILTAIIWINMAPLHENKLSKFLFYFGRYSLHNALRKI